MHYRDKKKHENILLCAKVYECEDVPVCEIYHLHCEGIYICENVLHTNTLIRSQLVYQNSLIGVLKTSSLKVITQVCYFLMFFLPKTTSGGVRVRV